MIKLNSKTKATLILICFLFVNLNHSNSQIIKGNIIADTSSILDTKQNNEVLLSGSGYSIHSDNFNIGAMNHPIQLIQGKVPGFIIKSNNSMDPNPDFQVQLRGISTLYLNSDPLYIVDGVPILSPTVIPTQNIDSIKVLRKISETARYGFRGSNGVVMVYTKKNSPQKINLVYSSYGYFEKFAKETDVMSASEWRQLKKDWSTSDFSILGSQSERMNDYGSETNWQNEISQNKFSQSHYFGGYGRINNTTYAAGVNINDHYGVIQKSNNSLQGGQISLSQQALKDKITFDLSLIGTKRQYSDIYNNPYLNSNSSIVYAANTFNPTVPTYAADTFGTSYIIHNPLQLIDGTEDDRSMVHSQLFLKTSYKILEGLNFSFSYSNQTSKSKNLYSKSYYAPVNHDYLFETEQEQSEKETIYDLKIDYHKSIGSHHFNTSISYTDLNNEYNNTYEESIIENEKVQDISRYFSKNQYHLKSIYTNINYGFKRKYYLSLGLSYETFPDPLTYFTNSEKLFPSLSVIWLLHKESFFVDKEWLDELKLHSNYGKAQRLDHLDLLKSGTNFMGNPDLKGDIMEEIDFGIDLSILSNKFGLSFDYYKRKTNNGVDIRYMPTGSVYPSLLLNNAKIKNNGFDVCIHSTPVLRPFRWTFNGNYSYNNNEVLSGSYIPEYNMKGHRVGDFMGLNFAGYNNNDETILLNNNGDTTNLLFENQEVLGNGVPAMFFGVTNLIGNYLAGYNCSKHSIFCKK
jgi:TonB-dependent starch-binding outer membrane protein SusC